MFQRDRTLDLISPVWIAYSVQTMFDSFMCLLKLFARRGECLKTKNSNLEPSRFYIGKVAAQWQHFANNHIPYLHVKEQDAKTILNRKYI
jgi:hypothetical protein